MIVADQWCHQSWVDRDVSPGFPIFEAVRTVDLVVCSI